MKRLGDGELEIMLAVWEAAGPVQSGYVHGRLMGSRSWAQPAVTRDFSPVRSGGAAAGIPP